MRSFEVQVEVEEKEDKTSQVVVGKGKKREEVPERRRKVKGARVETVCLLN